MKIEIRVIRSGLGPGPDQHRKAGVAASLEDACAMAYGIAKANSEDWAYLIIRWDKWDSEGVGGIGSGRFESSVQNFVARVRLEYTAKRAKFLAKRRQLKWLRGLGDRGQKVSLLVFGTQSGATDADPEARRAFLALDFPAVLRRAEQLVPAAA